MRRDGPVRTSLLSGVRRAPGVGGGRSGQDAQEGRRPESCRDRSGRTGRDPRCDRSSRAGRDRRRPFARRSPVATADERWDDERDATEVAGAAHGPVTSTYLSPRPSRRSRRTTGRPPLSRMTTDRPSRVAAAGRRFRADARTSTVYRWHRTGGEPADPDAPAATGRVPSAVDGAGRRRRARRCNRAGPGSAARSSVRTGRPRAVPTIRRGRRRP